MTSHALKIKFDWEAFGRKIQGARAGLSIKVFAGKHPAIALKTFHCASLGRPCSAETMLYLCAELGLDPMEFYMGPKED